MGNLEDVLLDFQIIRDFVDTFVLLLIKFIARQCTCDHLNRDVVCNAFFYGHLKVNSEFVGCFIVTRSSCLTGVFRSFEPDGSKLCLEDTGKQSLSDSCVIDSL